MKKMSEICWEAANERLWDGVSTKDEGWTYCCLAIDAFSQPPFASGEFLQATQTPSAGGGFKDISSREERQGARYMLLLFASYYFEDIEQ